MSNYKPNPNDSVIVPIGLDDANRFIKAHHRYMTVIHRARYCISAYHNGQLVGIVATTPPTNNKVDDGLTIEIARLCTHLAPYNTASALISRACKAARAMGFRKVITYVDASVDGACYRSCNFISGSEFLRRPWKKNLDCYDAKKTSSIRRLDLDLT